MPNLKEVRVRIGSVISTQQITKAMKMVSASKLRRAQTSIQQLRPYTRKLSAVIDNLNASLEGEIELPLATDRQVQHLAVVVVTSDKGLCGGFNANLIKTARKIIQNFQKQSGGKGMCTVIPVGKKGMDFFRKSDLRIDTRFVGLIQRPSFDQSATLGTALMDDFLNGIYDSVQVVYSEFKNPVIQYYRAHTFLPMVQDSGETSSDKKRTDYILEPNAAQIIAEMIPAYLRLSLHRAILDTNASEHGARMTSMDKATENAGELLKGLKLQYNRARQAAITTEITEIVGGAAALVG
ncbi:MAG: ATP synthase F1 subunit gamma [Sphingomonadales bacterium]|nr:ATP synthase F1 subunit gamma [Sphingomonadales bacterium]